MGIQYCLGMLRLRSNWRSHLMLQWRNWNALIEAKSVHSIGMNPLTKFDVVRKNSLLELSDKVGGILGTTHVLFDDMLENNVLSWTLMISMNAQKGFNDQALGYFLRMQRIGIEPNEFTLSTVLGVCCKLGRVDVGMSLHCLILKKGFEKELFVGSSLIKMYSKCDFIEEARWVFDEMLERDAISWNSMIAAYSQKGLNEEAISLFSLMLMKNANWKLLVNEFTYASVFKACAGFGCGRIGKSLHNYTIKLGFDLDIFVAGSTIDMYSKCGSIDVASSVFNQMQKRDLVAWNAMIMGYAQNYRGEEAIELFNRLQYEGFIPNDTTFSCVLKASTMILNSALGKCFHALTIKYGSSSDLFVGTALVDMYSKIFDMEDAEIVFGEMITRNVVSFNALITGYSLTWRYEEALRVYAELQTKNVKPDSFTFTGLFSSCCVLDALTEGTQVHAHLIRFGLDSDVSTGNALVNFYAKSGLMESASMAFKCVTTPNIISWAGIISGFAQNGEGEKALEYFCKMHKASQKPDEFSFASIFKALAGWAAVEQGRNLHAHVIKMGLESAVFVGSSLIDMYSKCGMAEDSFNVFTKMPEKNAVSWNSMIMGYAQNGFSKKALLLFHEMIDSGVMPTCITFVGVLFACSHAGMVEEGRHYYNLMVFNYEIPPSVEHCTCMVDLLGRAGYLNEAESFLLKSPFPSEPGIWKSLLAACGIHNNINVGIRAAQHCLWLEPHDSATYVILSNIYAYKHLWNEVKRIRDLMKEIGVEKETGCSWVQIRNTVHVFVAEDRSCFPEEIVATLESFIVHSKLDDYDLQDRIYAS